MLPEVDYFLRSHVDLGHPVLVGEAPGPTGDPSKPLTGRVGRRLAELAGVAFPAAFIRRFGRVNLLDSWPGADAGGGSLFDAEGGARAAEALLRVVTRSTRLVLLGRRVAAAFALPDDMEWFRWSRLAAAPAPLVVVAPHPSASSRWWNEPANVEAARLFFEALAATAHVP